MQVTWAWWSWTPHEPLQPPESLVDDASLLGDWRPDHVVELQSGLDEWSRGALYLPPLQRMAYHRAVAKGLNPDQPTHLSAVVEL
mgnify:CR=1 FL=1